MQRPAIVLAATIFLAACQPPQASPTTSTPAPSETPAPPPTATTTTTPTPIPLLGDSRTLGRGRIVAAQFLPGAHEVVVAQAGGVSLVQVDGGAEVWWSLSPLPVVALTTHPAGTEIAALLRDRSLLILDAASGAVKSHYKTLTSGYALWGQVAWSPDGQKIAFQSLGPNRDDPIYLLDPATGDFSEIPHSTPPSSFVPVLIWSPDSRQITARPGTTICVGVIDVSSGETVIPPEDPLGLVTPTAPGEPGSCIDPLAWSPDGSLILTSGAGLIDARTGRTVHKMPVDYGSNFKYGQFATFNQDGTLFAAGGVIDDYWGVASPLTVWDVKTGSLVARLGYHHGVDSMRDRAHTRVAMAFDGDSVVGLHADGEISRWRFGEGAAGLRQIGLVPIRAATLDWIWSPDSRLLATADQLGGVLIWSPGSPDPVAAFDDRYTGAAFSPDSQQVAVINSATRQIEVVNLADGSLGLKLPNATLRRTQYSSPSEDFGSTAWSPDGKWIAYRSTNRVIVADSSTGQKVATLEAGPPQHDVTYVAWSPDSKALVSIAGNIDDESKPGEMIVWKRSGETAFVEISRSPTAFYRYDLQDLSHQTLFNPKGDLIAIHASQNTITDRHTVLTSHTISVLDLQTGKTALGTDSNQLALITWLGDNELATLANVDGWMTGFVWNVRTGQSTSKRLSVTLAERYFGATFVQPDINLVRVMNWQTGETLATVPDYGIDTGSPIWSPDGRWIASIDLEYGLLRLWPVNR